MTMNNPMTPMELFELVFDAMPWAGLSQDERGQYIIHTGIYDSHQELLDNLQNGSDSIIL